MSTQSGLADITSRMPSITLEKVLATAELQTRVDRKYVVSLDVLRSALDRRADELSVLEVGGLRMFRYESVYFDTPGLAAYRQHAHGRRRRVKIRTRTYLDSGDCLLEFKSVGVRGETIKERYPYHLTLRHDLDAEARTLASERVGHVISTSALRRVLTTGYHRVTLVDPARGDRVTCDIGLRFESSAGCHGPLDGIVVIESKTGGAESPIDRSLRRLGVRPLSLSKYCIGMALLDPRLPANRWNRELRTHFGWTPQPHGRGGPSTPRRS